MAIDFAENNWLMAANKLYKNEKDLYRNYRRSINASPILTEKEQEWCDLYFQELADRLTSDDIWRKMIPGLDLYGVNIRQSQRYIQVSGKDQAHYSGSHWTARKGDDKKWFDSHHEYQPQGTNQFCGIFAMMHLLERLEKSSDRTFRRYYDYTRLALEFCEEVIKKCLKGREKKLYLDIVKVSLENYPALINILEFPSHI